MEGGVQPAPGSALYNDYSDTDGHGSHCAGSIGAVGNNGVGISGVSWNVSLYACKAVSTDGYLYNSAILDCYALCREVRPAWAGE